MIQVENAIKDRITQVQEGQEPNGAIMMKYILKQTTGQKYCIFVEGDTDEKYYSNCKHSFLNKNSAVYLCGPSMNSESTGLIGKKWVINAFKEMMAWEAKKEDRSRWIFIVDRDYEPAEITGINNTKYHSVESYFLTNENLKTIFSRLDPNKYNEFVRLGEAFANDFLDYFLLKTTINAFYNYNKKIQVSMTTQHGMSFLISKKDNEVTYEVAATYLADTKNMKAIIQSGQYPKAEEYYNTLCAKYPPTLANIRGHNAIFFLKEYIKSQIQPDFTDDRLRGFFKILNLDIVFVNAFGEPLQ